MYGFVLPELLYFFSVDVFFYLLKKYISLEVGGKINWLQLILTALIIRIGEGAFLCFNEGIIQNPLHIV